MISIGEAVGGIAWLWRAIAFRFYSFIKLKKLGFYHNSVIERGDDKYVIVKMSIKNKNIGEMTTITEYEVRPIKPENLRVGFEKVNLNTEFPELGLSIKGHINPSETISGDPSEYFDLTQKTIPLNPGQEIVTNFCVKVDNLTLPSEFGIFMKDTSGKECKAEIKIENKNGQVVLF